MTNIIHNITKNGKHQILITVNGKPRAGLITGDLIKAINFKARHA